MYMYPTYNTPSYSLNMKHYLQAHDLGAWWPADGFWGSDRILKALTYQWTSPLTES
jgi:hypothetical protein